MKTRNKPVRKTRKKSTRKTRKKSVRKTRKRSVRKTRKKSVRKTINLRGGYSCTSPCNRWYNRMPLLGWHEHPWCWAEDGTNKSSSGYNWEYCNPNIDPLSKGVTIQGVMATEKTYLNGLEGEMIGKSRDRILVKVSRDGTEELVSLLPTKLRKTAGKHCDQCEGLNTSPSLEDLDEITDSQNSDLSREHTARREARKEIAETGIRTAGEVEQMKRDRDIKVTVIEPSGDGSFLGREATQSERNGRRARTKISLSKWATEMGADGDQQEVTRSGTEKLGRKVGFAD